MSSMTNSDGNCPVTSKSRSTERKMMYWKCIGFNASATKGIHLESYLKKILRNDLMILENTKPMEKQFESLCPVVKERARKQRLADNEVSLKFKKDTGDYQITFSTRMSKVIKSHHLELMDIRRDNLTDEIDLVLSNKFGLRISCSGNGSNVNLCSKNVLQEIYNTYGFEEKSRRVKITKNLSKRDGYLVFRLLPQMGERNLFE